MKKFTQAVVQRLIPRWDAVRDPAVRHRYGRLEGGVSIGVNTVLFILKFLWGILSGSVALIADGIHTLSDVLTSIVIIVSFRIAGKPSDKTHPFGHGRMEAVASVIVAVLLMVAGVEILKSSVDRLLHPLPVQFSWTLIAVIGLTIVLKELLARFSYHLGRMIESNALEADFWHHRTDVISSVLVLIAMFVQRWGWSFFDGAAGIVVAGLIVMTGWRIAHQSVNDLLGTRPSQQFIDAVKRRAREVPGVLDVHDLIIHQYGQKRVMSFHIVVSEDLSLREGHELADTVASVVDDAFHTHSTIHLDPFDPADPEIERISRVVEELLRGKNAGFHDLQIRKEGQRGEVSFDIVPSPAMTDQEIAALTEAIDLALRSRFRWIRAVRIRPEPGYTL